MKRRKLLSLLGLAPAVPLVAKQMLDVTPQNPAPTAESELPPGGIFWLYGEHGTKTWYVPHADDFDRGLVANQWYTVHWSSKQVFTLRPVGDVYA